MHKKIRTTKTLNNKLRILLYFGTLFFISLATIGTILANSSETSNYQLKWQYSSSTTFSVNNLRVALTGDDTATLSYNSGGSSSALFESSNGYKLSVIGEFVSYDLLPKKGTLTTKSGTIIPNYPIDNDNQLNPTAASVTGTVYFEKEGTRTPGEELDIVITNSAGYSETVRTGNDGAYSTSLPCNSNYTLTIDEDTTGFLARIASSSPLIGIITGAERTRVYGQASLSINSQCENSSAFTPVTPIVVDIVVTETTESPFEEAIKKAIIMVGNSISWFITMVTGWINHFIDASADIDNTVLQAIWKSSRDIVLGLLTLAILIIAFANILNIQLDQYGLPRMMPKLIIGIVMVYFSYFISIFLLQFTQALQRLMIDSMSGAGLATSEVSTLAIGGGNFMEGVLNTGTLIIQAIILLLLMLFLLLVFIWLMFILMVRRAMLLILIAVVPIAFAANILPFTEKYTSMWWKNFWKWSLMGPAIVFMLLLANNFITIGWLGSHTSFDSAYVDSWIYLIVYGVLIFLAGYVPLSLGKEIYNKVGAQKVPGAISKKTGLKDALAGRQTSIAARDKARGERLRSSIALSGKGADSRVRRFMAGVDKDQAREIESARVNEIVSNFEKQDITKKDAQKRYLLAEGDERKALARLQSKNGWFDDSDVDSIRRFSEDFAADAYVRNNAPKEQADLLSAADLAGFGDYGTDDVKIGRTSSALRGKAYSGVTDLKLPQISQMMRPENHHELKGFFTNYQKLAKANETWDDRRLSAMGRAFKTLSTQEVAELINDPNTTNEHKAIITRMAKLDAERTQAMANGQEGMEVLHQIDFKGNQGKREV